VSPAIVVVGDVGIRHDEFHVGDEAMTEALINELTKRGVRIAALISADPAESAARYSVPTLGRLGFDVAATATRAARELRLTEITLAATEPRRLDPADPAVRVIEAITAADGLVVAGGGNLSSLWPEHVYERSALIAIASALGKPVVVSGQTLGPALATRDGVLLCEMLGRASLVGVREATSFGIAQQLGVPADVLRLTCDDALWLKGAVSAESLPADYCVVTIAPWAGLVDLQCLVPSIARLLDRVIEVTGCDIVFVPHLGVLSADAKSADQVVHQDIIGAMSNTRVHALPMLDPKTVAQITRKAAMSISTRYHPVVFASSSGVPAVGISVDEYTGVKIGGALDLVGLGEFHIPLSMLASGQAETVALAAWSAREAISQHAASVEPLLRERSSRWWDDVVAVLSDQTVSAVTEEAVPALHVLSTDLVTTKQRMLAWQRAETSRVTANNLATVDESEAAHRVAVILDLQRRLSALEAALADEDSAHRVAVVLDLQRRLGASEAALADAELRVSNAETERDAAWELAAKVAEPLFEKRLRDGRMDTAAIELEALLKALIFRWKAGARHLYGRVRGVARRVLRSGRS
jgi:polysaccharide pyruvyl transferase WcaK-like protein